MAEHSPLPWMVGERNGNDGDALCGIENTDWTLADVWADAWELTPAIARANADFIVRCVNSHDELLAALRAVVADAYEMNPCTGESVCTFCVQEKSDPHLNNCPMVAVDQAIAKAEAK